MKNETTYSYRSVVNSIDLGLRKYMLNVFSYMSVGLALTAFVSYLTGGSSTLMAILFSLPLISVLFMIIPFGIVLYLSSRIASISSERAKTLFFVYAACLGVSLSSVFMVYTAASITYSFFIASSMFLSMVIYGYTTDKDLTSVGSFLFMGLIGLIITSLVNIFVRSSFMEMVISASGVLIFTGLTAYDAQVIKSYYMDSDSGEVTEKKAIFGALKLYMDFLNLFLYVLRFMGSRRD